MKEDFELLLLDRIAAIQAADKQYDLQNNAYISFSGGADSTALHYLIDEALPGNRIPRLYVNTGIDYNKITEYVKKLADNDDRIIMIKPTLPIKQTLEKYGYPFKNKDFSYRYGLFQRLGFTKGIKKWLTLNGWIGVPQKLKELFTEDKKISDIKISDKCCIKLKEEPLINKSKELNRNIAIIGILGDESGRRRRFVKNCFTKTKEQVKFYPMVKVNKEFEKWFLNKKNIKLCELYYEPFNFERTGCKGCPFDLHLQKDLETMQKYFPNERKQCEVIWEPIYDKYRKMGYRLKKDKKCKKLF